ncbi:MAG: PEP-CTERM sorting domain-containing protein [Acidobacteriales bacterium]|nr:PEP-CTERM sorting domain-containing protein [Terriglobales bacterium]
MAGRSMFSSFLVLVLVIVLSPALKADLVQDTPFQVDLNGQGFGKILEILTLHMDTTESGKVVWTGSADAITGCLLGGGAAADCVGPTDTGADPSKTATRTFSEIGWLGAEDIRIILDANQTGVNPTVDLHTLIMRFYAPDGTQLGGDVFHIAAPMDITEAQGQGNAGFVFKLTPGQVALANAAAFGVNYDPNNRVGLEAIIGDVNDGADTFYAFDANIVPEPAAYLVLLAGLSGVVYLVKRHRQSA